MKQALCMFAFILISVSSSSQRKDTLFLRRSIYIDTANNYTIYHAIFVDTDYTCSKLNTLVDFGFNNFDSTTYFDCLQQLKKTKLQKQDINRKLPRKWISLYQYKNEFYTYHPSDLGNHYKFQITDTTTLDFTMEGPEPSLLLSTKQISANKIELRRKNYWQSSRLTITVIDTAKGVAIFTFSPTKYIPHTHKKLMVSADKVHLFKTIVNYCQTDKMSEFEFDKIDFKQLEKIEYRQ